MNMKALECALFKTVLFCGGLALGSVLFISLMNGMITLLGLPEVAGIFISFAFAFTAIVILMYNYSDSKNQPPKKTTKCEHCGRECVSESRTEPTTKEYWAQGPDGIT